MRPLAAGALIVTLFAAPAIAQEAPTPPTDAPGVVEPAPILIPNSSVRLRNDLEILRAALEGYRAAHFFRYPAAGSVEALVEILVHTGDLPAGFRIQGTITEFSAQRGGYRISARTNGDVLTIRTPERFNPLWAMLLHPL